MVVTRNLYQTEQAPDTAADALTSADWALDVAWAKARNAITMLARLLRQGDSPPWLRCATRRHYCWAAVERLLATDNA